MVWRHSQDHSRGLAEGGQGGDAALDAACVEVVVEHRAGSKLDWWRQRPLCHVGSRPPSVVGRWWVTGVCGCPDKGVLALHSAWLCRLEDLGLKQFTVAELFTRIFIPTSFLLVCILHLHYFHDRFLELTDLKSIPSKEDSTIYR